MCMGDVQTDDTIRTERLHHSLVLIIVDASIGGGNDIIVNSCIYVGNGMLCRFLVQRRAQIASK